MIFGGGLKMGNERNSTPCLGCAGSGGFVATQDMIKDAEAFHTLPAAMIEALRDAAPMPAIVPCPACGGTGSMLACRVCGCTDEDCSQCVEKTGGPCHWVEPDLCSACVGESGR